MDEHIVYEHRIKDMANQAKNKKADYTVNNLSEICDVL